MKHTHESSSSIKSVENTSDKAEKPIMMALHATESIEEADRLTFMEIGKRINDQSKLRNFDCLFISKNQRAAKELGNELRAKQGYEVGSPYRGKGGWTIHAIKQILQADLITNLDTARITSANHSSSLVDWMFEVS
jgi:hypothetical protein